MFTEAEKAAIKVVLTYLDGNQRKIRESGIPRPKGFRFPSSTQIQQICDKLDYQSDFDTLAQFRFHQLVLELEKLPEQEQIEITIYNRQWSRRQRIKLTLDQFSLYIVYPRNFMQPDVGKLGQMRDIVDSLLRQRPPAEIVGTEEGASDELVVLRNLISQEYERLLL